MNETAETPDMTKEDVAALLRLKPESVNLFARQGRFPSYWIGKRRLFKRSDIVAFVEKNRHEAGSFPQMSRASAASRMR